MKPLAALILALAVLGPIKAEAYFLSCGVAADAILYGTPQQQGIAIGHGTGVVDMLTSLTCYVGGASCGCLDRLLINNVDAYSDAVAQELATCAVRTPNVSAVGPALRAAKRVCG
jgi:hypothetical protein